MVTCFQIYRCKILTFTDSSYRFQEIWTRPPISYCPPVDCAVVHTHPIVLARLPLRDKYNLVKVCVGVSIRNDTCRLEFIDFCLNPCTLFRTVLDRSLPNRRARFDLHIEWMINDTPYITLMYRKIVLKSHQLLKVVSIITPLCAPNFQVTEQPVSA